MSKSYYIYLNYYPNGYLYVGSHSWSGPINIIDSTYTGSSSVAKHFNWKPSKITILESSNKSLLKREAYWINLYASLYGIADCALNLYSNEWTSKYKPHGLLLNLHANTCEQAYVKGLPKCMDHLVRVKACKKAIQTQINRNPSKLSQLTSELSIAKMVKTKQSKGLFNQTKETRDKINNTKSLLKTSTYGRHVIVNVYKGTELLYNGTPTEVCRSLGHKNWQTSLSKYLKLRTKFTFHDYVFEFVGYKNPMTVFNDHNIHNMDKRRIKSYERIKSLCVSNNVTPLFSVEDYRGQANYRYPVKCNSCGKVYDAWFKVAEQRMSKCSCHSTKVTNPQMLKMIALLNSIKLDYKINYKIQSFVIDLFIPSKSIGFLFNNQLERNSGIECKVNKNHFINVTNVCLSEGIKIYQFWDFTSPSLCLSIIKSKLGISEKVYARKAEVKTISKQLAKEFFSENHIDGYVVSNINCGLFLNSEMVAGITLLNRRIQSLHKNVWEIGRFATKQNITVVGGYSKLLKYALSELKKSGSYPEYLVSYCNRDISPDPNDTFYSKHGFIFDSNSGPIYWYVASDTFNYLNRVILKGKKYNRQLCQKQKLLKHYNDNNIPLPDPCTEDTLAQGLGFRPVYNSGNFKYILKL